MIEAARAGFVLGFALILAIGAQNAFVLRQGIRREHVLPVVLTCAISDSLLIAAGVAGIGALIEAMPWLVPAFRWGGALFLIVYGAMSFYSAFMGEDALATEGSTATSLKAALITVLGLTFLNPHVYLDTVILLGSVSNTRFPDDSLAFAIGAMAASFVFFFSLGYGARLLSPIFANPRAWRILDVIVGITMWSIAAGLILKG